MRHPVALFTAFVLLLALTSVACGGSATPEPPTSQPSPPTAPPSPTPSTSAPAQIPGWEPFSAGGVTLSLPESFEGGDLESDLPAIVARLEALGPDFEPIVQQIEQNPGIFALWAFDTVVGPSGTLTSAAVTHEAIPSSIPLETYVDAAKAQFPSTFQVVDTQIGTTPDGQDARLVIEFEVMGIPGKELLYILKHGGDIWVLTLATGAEEFDTRLPDFEQAIASFAVDN